MKKCVFLLLLFLCVNVSFAQSDSLKTWFSVSFNNNQYGSIVNAPFENMLSIDAASFSLGAERYLGKSLNLSLLVSLGEISLNGLKRASYVGADVQLKYKLNNGKLLSESSKFAPYLALGVGVANFDDSPIPAEDGTYLGISPKVGIDYFLSEKFKIGISTAYKINESIRYREYAIGIGFSLKKGKDTDGDGTPDKRDACPNTFGPPESKGCPEEVITEQPAEEEAPVSTEEETNPSRVDTTYVLPDPEKPADPQPEEEKKEESEESVSEEKEAPVDTDGDGVPDSVDACPNQRGLRVNDGCPEVRRIGPLWELPITSISFAEGTATISAQDYGGLNQLAQLMKQDESFKIELNGFGDFDSDEEANKTLSAERIDAVKAYLIAKGISKYRFISNELGTPGNAYQAGRVLLEIIVN